MEREDLIDFMVNKGNGVKGLSQLKLDRIPDAFIQPPTHRLSHIQVATHEFIPLIDASNWDDPKVSESICNAAASFGFFHIINHGIPNHVVENVKRAAHDFFELPVEERRKYLPENSLTPTVKLQASFNPLSEKYLEWKDYLFHLAADDQIQDSQFWPLVSRLAMKDNGFKIDNNGYKIVVVSRKDNRDSVLEYINFVKPIIRKILEVLLRGINLKQLDEVRESALMGSLALSLFYYPICPNPELVAGTGPHSDISSITILLQDDVGGLYVRAHEGDQWVHVPPMEGSIVVNVGDVLQIMSNGKYKSIEHRVFLSGNKNRVSVPVFANPALDAVIGPPPEVLEVGEKPIYKQLVFSDYLNNFFSRIYEGKKAIEYAEV